MVYFKDLHIGLLILGVGAIIQNLVSGLLSPAIGMLADRIDRDGLLIATGLSFEAISLVVFAITFREPQLGNILILVGTCILGFGQAFYHPIGGSVFTVLFPKGTFERYLGFNGSIAGTSRAVLPSVLGIATVSLGYSRGLLAIVLYMVIAILLIFYALYPFRRVDYQPHTVENQESVSTQKAVKSKVGFEKYRGFLVLLISIIFLRSMFTSAVTTYLPLYLSLYIGSGLFLNMFLSIIFIPAIAGQPFMGIVTARKGGGFTVTMTTILAVVIFTLFMLTHNPIIMLVTFSTFAFAVFTGFPVLIGYVGQVMPKEFLTSANSLVWGVGGTVGAAAGLVVVVVLLSLSLSLVTIFWITLIFGLAALVLLTILPRVARQLNKQPDTFGT